MENAFSKTLLQFRDKHNLSKTEMAAILELSQRMYDYYEDGTYDGSERRTKKYLQKLADYEESKNIAKEPATAYGNTRPANAKELMAYVNNLEELVALQRRIIADLDKQVATLRKD